MQTHDVPNHARAYSHIAYRPDIDGLRAIAVLAVMAFHLQIRYALGGFTGVDVFFVISGYLITSIVMADMDAGSFTLARFYTRRIRRIYPALVVVMAATSAVALIVCMPEELRDYAKMLISVSLSASNLYLGLHSTYFEPQSQRRPVLQTWSLGVEEQFYFLFPLMLVLLRRWAPRHLKLILGVLTVASFTASIISGLQSPSLAFFMPWTRACELLFGALLALGVLPRTNSVAWRNTAAGFGLAVMLLGFLLINGAVPFPGFAALIPCGSAMLLIWSGQPQQIAEGTRELPAPTMVARWLGSRPAVFVGLISYSLYLWHWPVIVFQSLGLWGDNLSHRAMKGVLVLLSFTLAVLSWRFVERPFRDGKLRLTTGSAFLFYAVSSSVLVLLGVGMLALHGLPGRFPANAAAVAQYVDEPLHNRMGSCMVIRARDFKPDPCLTEDPNRPNWLLIGDSHAASEWEGLAKAYPNVHFLQVSRASCRPDPVRTDGDCGVLMHGIFTQFLPTHHIDRMVVVGRWVAVDIPAIDRLVAWTRARGIPLTLVGPTQDYDAPLPRLLAYGMLRHQPDFANGHLAPGTADLDSKLAQLAATRWHVPYLSLVKMFCPNGVCQVYTNAARTVPLLVDEDHFTNEGSDLAGQRIATGGLLFAKSE